MILGFSVSRVAQCYMIDLLRVWFRSELLFLLHLSPSFVSHREPFALSLLVVHFVIPKSLFLFNQLRPSHTSHSFVASKFHTLGWKAHVRVKSLLETPWFPSNLQAWFYYLAPNVWCHLFFMPVFPYVVGCQCCGWIEKPICLGIWGASFVALLKWDTYKLMLPLPYSFACLRL